LTPAAPQPAPVTTPALTPAAPQAAPVTTPALTPAAPQPAPVTTPALTPAAPQPAPVTTPTLTPAAPQPAPVTTPALTPAAPQAAPVTTPALTPAAPQPAPIATPAPPPPQFAALPTPRLDFRAAASEAASAPACGLIATADGPDWLSLRGVLRQGSEAALRRALAARDIPAAAQRLALQSFDGPYCPALDLLRPVLAAPEAAPQVRVTGAQPLRAGQLLRFDVTMPDWPAHLYVAYLMKSGEVAHLVPSAQHAAGATVRLGEPRAGFPGWEVSEPFGTDLLVAIVSEGPLLGPGRPLIETQDVFRQAMATALAQAQRERRRVLIRPYVIETTP
jgi:serine/threonine-protein kinase